MLKLLQVLLLVFSCLRLTAVDALMPVSNDFAVLVSGIPKEFSSAEITAPDDSATVTAPTNIMGTGSSTILQSYQLQYRLREDEDGTNWVSFATGTSSVINGVLGVFDPTLLLNGIYEIRLQVTDTAGRTVV